MSCRKLDFIQIKVNVVGLHPTPDQGGLLVLSSLDAPRRPPTELKAPWAFSVLMLSRQTLIPDSTDAISASMPRSRNERKCPAATPRGGCNL